MPDTRVWKSCSDGRVFSVSSEGNDRKSEDDLALALADIQCHIVLAVPPLEAVRIVEH
jgi:hypothetical protein